ncbi:unnamed protein product [Schistosoma bovis]|nr:unnamed protein product [Schistosoma bovis]
MLNYMFDYFVFGLILLCSDSIYGQIETTKEESVTDQGWVRFTMNHNPLIVSPRRLPQKYVKYPNSKVSSPRFHEYNVIIENKDTCFILNRWYFKQINVSSDKKLSKRTMNTLYCSICIVVIIYAYFDMVNGVPEPNKFVDEDGVPVRGKPATPIKVSAIKIPVNKTMKVESENLYDCAIVYRYLYIIQMKWIISNNLCKS